MERFTTTYLMETPVLLANAAAEMAGEQSLGTFIKLAGEGGPIVRRQVPIVEKLTALEKVGAPSLAGATASPGNIGEATRLEPRRHAGYRRGSRYGRRSSGRGQGADRREGSDGIQ